MISIIIPTYNEEDTIQKTLDQFLCIEYPTEIIVADGGSTDDTKKIVRKIIAQKTCSCSVQLVLAPPRGRGPTMQTGAEHAQGDYLLFLHADTIVPKNWCEELIKALASPNIIGGAFKLSFDNKERFYSIASAYSNLRARLFHIYHGDQAIFIRKSVYRRIGGFPLVPLMEDVILSKRMKAFGKTTQLSCAVSTSPRRIAQYGKMKSIFRYFTIKTLFFFGVSPKKLTKLYK